MNENDKVFDVSRPHKVAPDASGKPIIVGHHPEMPDPMVREHVPAKPHTEINITPPSGNADSGPTPETPAPVSQTPIVPATDLPEDQPAGSLPGEVHSPQLDKPVSAPQPQAWHPDSQLPIPTSSAGGHGGFGMYKKVAVAILLLAVLLVGAYIALSAELI